VPEATETLDDTPLVRPHDLDGREGDQEEHDHDDGEDDHTRIHCSS
jgi:hypothetical protein